MVTKKTWEDFRKTGLLFFVNQILHAFGWAIVVEVDDNDTTKVLNTYPARVKFRGFVEKVTMEGYLNIAKYLDKESSELLKEAQE